jgi:hypothetical protein
LRLFLPCTCKNQKQTCQSLKELLTFDVEREMADWSDTARGNLAGLVEVNRFAARGMVRG